MSTRADIRAEAARLLAAFEAAGAERIETDVLQPADVLLDLYGEDIRARAYVTHDYGVGEQMLRPDFTVPVVLAHMAAGQQTARYAYSGKVFRRQDRDAAKPREYVQVGYEIFEAGDPAQSDAEVFALMRAAIADLPLRMATGDIGVLTAAVNGLATTERRRAALMRHIWRPRRFRALLERFGGRGEMPAGRARLLAAEAPLAGVGTWIGLRGRGEVEERIAVLREDAAEPPIAAGEVDLLEALMAVADKAPAALERLGALATELPALAPAVDRMARRLDALAARGVDVADVDFEASYGRTSMEYYDGFVFGFYAADRPDLPPVATGGRYDALTRQLGGGREIPAVGGVVRPAVVLALREGAA